MTILEIHRMSIHNGPGIRTMVHLKGCPLRCVWCSTPESQLSRPQLGEFPGKCIGCGKCLTVCPQQAISFSADGRTVTDRNRCTDCLACAGACDTLARKALGREMTAGELKAEIMKDKIFYDTSGGGACFSGGEVMMHMDDELLNLIRELHEEDISIGLDTCGYAEKEKFEKVMPYVDYFLWDLKQMDPNRHYEITGGDLNVILDNLAFADSCGPDIYLRCPVIPGYTDDEKNLEMICKAAKGLKHLKEVHLIPFHHMGTSRYESIGKRDPLAKAALIPDETMEHKRQYVHDQGLPVKITG